MMLSTLALAFAQPLGGTIADAIWSVTGGGGGKGKEGDWDPKWRQQAQQAAIGVAVVSFYGLDFAVNALVRRLPAHSSRIPPFGAQPAADRNAVPACPTLQQASLRNLLLDVTPAEQLSSANAWQGRVSPLLRCRCPPTAVDEC